MIFIKRAGLYCFRQRCRTLILFLLLTVAAAFILTGIAIRDAAKGASADVRTAVGGKIILDIDKDGNMGSSEQYDWGTAATYNGDQITQKLVDAIGKVEGVADYNAELTPGYYGAGVNFDYLPATYELSYTPYGEASIYTVTLSSGKCTSFLSGKYRLVAGRHITPDDQYTCLISKELADYNRLSVGDIIKMYSLDSGFISEFQIVGIFDGTEGSPGNSGNADTVSDIPANQGYIDYAALQDIFKDKYNIDYYQHLSIFVEDPANIQKVYDKISALPELKGKTLKLTIDTEEYDVISTPLTSLQTLVDTTVGIVCAVSVAVLTLLLTIWIRGRKKEIGILLSVGKSKADILLQIFTETFAVAMLSFTAAIPLGRLTAQRAGAFLVSRAAAGTAGLTVRMAAAYLPAFYVTGTVLVAVSVLASAWTVVRLKPNDILAKMS